MQFDRPENQDKPADANATTTSEFHNDLFRQPENINLAGWTQEASLPNDNNTVITPGLGGLIKDMKFPGSWTKVEQEPAVPGFEIELYSLSGAKDVFMSYKYRGGDPYITAGDIHRTMREPDHRLNMSEMEHVRNGFDNDQGLPEYFDLKQAWTQTVNNRRVLFVEGVHKQDPVKGLHVLTAYLDSDPSRPGRLPESITYFAKGEDQNNFEKYRPLAMKAFESMEFKAHVDTSNPGFSSLN